jgi:hypothetical protein
MQYLVQRVGLVFLCSSRYLEDPPRCRNVYEFNTCHELYSALCICWWMCWLHCAVIMQYTPTHSVSDKILFYIYFKRWANGKVQTVRDYKHHVCLTTLSEVCLCMFQMPLHFDRTGVRVVALCPGATDTTICRNVNVICDKEWNTFLNGLTFQP